MNEQVSVLIVDDSALFRQLLHKILNGDPSIEVIATAADPYIAANKLTKQVPDVIILDYYMPRMNGLTFLRKIMSQHPIPVVFLADIDSEGSEIAYKALEYGAVDVLSKEIFVTSGSTEEAASRIREVVKRAAHTQLKKRFFADMAVVPPKLSADAVLQATRTNSQLTSAKIVAVGASTGGTEAIKVFLEALPPDAPGVVIVQHMPENFTKAFADRLNDLCQIRVKEAEDGDLIEAGVALIAPGNQHMMVKRRGTKYYVELNSGPLVNRHRPSVDVLFRSAAIYAGKNCIGILMTGMGDDGAKGLLEIREAGGRTIAQDERSCVVFGMPKEAIQLNAAESVLPLGGIAQYVMDELLA
ncbi:chemotaxis response regulator protein-glutamate methylesterase [Mucilaginibacter sp. Bleaf8]|uniref:protein-glutamate methylesterase/protein-glutamine glutaminase n=1 Tax=Mucilaginibacter sp. Bleaf8 TaxID=2834430 RepID=UPI001BD169D0|nr:chemotaxis response regulator protein-glutamate methylesterase [Mucilaginibacter sp. Bleaf8]MBS7566784.1 chemotaxis response regulator protein-glutamate methylesterase [Mucilaginibacter sp. Bleaf8]